MTTAAVCLEIRSSPRAILAEMILPRIADSCNRENGNPVRQPERVALLSIETIRPLVGSPENASQHVNALLQTLASEDEEVRAWASDALAECSPIEKDWQHIAGMIDSPNAVVAGWSCKLLGRSATCATLFQGRLANALKNHSDVGVRQMAALALRSAETINDATRVALEGAALSADPRLQRLAKRALKGKEEAA